MFCENCGKELREGARFCVSCGAPVEDGRKGAAPLNKATSDLMASGMQMIQNNFAKPSPSDEQALSSLASEESDWEDAVYYDDPSLPMGMMRNSRGDIHWNISLDLSKNPFILHTAYKLFMGPSFLIGIIIVIVCCALGGTIGDILMISGIFFGVGAGLAIVCKIVYSLTMAVGGSVYTVDHLMTEEKISYNLLESESDETHKQRAEILLWFVDYCGKGIASLMMDFEPNKDFDSQYSEVRRITADKSHNIIRLKHRVLENRIYVEPQQFDFVFNYLTSHCKKATVIK